MQENRAFNGTLNPWQMPHCRGAPEYKRSAYKVSLLFQLLFTAWNGQALLQCVLKVVPSCLLSPSLGTWDGKTCVKAHSRHAPSVFNVLWDLSAQLCKHLLIRITDWSGVLWFPPPPKKRGCGSSWKKKIDKCNPEDSRFSALSPHVLSSPQTGPQT